MEEILKIILDYGLTGGCLVTMSWVIVQQMTLLNKIEERMSRQEEIQRQTLEEIRDVKDMRAEMLTAVEYCKSKNLNK